MDQFTNRPAGGSPGAGSPPPVVVLRDELTQTTAAVDQLRSILGQADDPGRGPGARR